MSLRELTSLSMVWLSLTLALLLASGISSYQGAFWFALMVGATGWANFIMLAWFPKLIVKKEDDNASL